MAEQDQLDTVPGLRDHAKGLEKDLKETKEALGKSELKSARLEARDAFGEAGYQRSFGDLFAVAKPGEGATTELIEQFAADYSLSKAPVSDGSSAGAGDPAGGGNPPLTDGALGSMSGAASGAGAGGQRATDVEKMSTSEWAKLASTDKAAAERAVLEGRVGLSEDNFWVKQGLVQA